MMKEKIKIVAKDICSMEVDAIICQANTELEMEDRATWRMIERGGDVIHNECNGQESLTTGMSVCTPAGKLLASYLIHAVINKRGEKAREDQTMTAIRSALNMAKEKQFQTLAIPLIGPSAGIPVKRAAELILTEIKKHFDSDTTVESIILAAHSRASFEAFDEGLKQL